jgi:hypothetical protein
MEDFDTFKKKEASRHQSQNAEKQLRNCYRRSRKASHLFCPMIRPGCQISRDSDEIERLYHRGEPEERTLIMIKPARTNDKRISKRLFHHLLEISNQVQARQNIPISTSKLSI